MTKDQERIDELDRKIRLRQLEAHFASRKKDKPEPQEKDAWYEDLAEGVAVSGMGTWYGLKDLFGGMSEEDRKTFEDWKTDAGESLWGGVGQGVGELAQLAVPGAGAMKLAKTIGKAKRLIPFTADVASSAGLGALQAPDVGENRLMNAIGGGGSALLGGALGRALSKPFRGAKIDDEARVLMDEGVRLTPGQAASGSLPRALEQIAQWKLFSGKGVQRARQEGIRDWNRLAFRVASPPGHQVNDIGETGLIKMKEAFDNAYSSAWKNANKPSQTGMVNMINNVVRQGGELNADSQHVIRNLLMDVRDISYRYTPEKVEQLDKKLRRRINSAFRENNHDLGYALKEMKNDLREAIGPDFAGKLRAIDNKYDSYRAIRKAATSKRSLKAGKVFTPDDLIDASKTVAGESRTSVGANPLQREIMLGDATVGRHEYKPLIDMRKALIQNSPDLTLGGYRGLGNFIMGETRPQKALRSALSPIGNALRNLGVSSTTAGTAFLDGDY